VIAAIKNSMSGEKISQNAKRFESRPLSVRFFFGFTNYRPIFFKENDSGSNDSTERELVKTYVLPEWSYRTFVPPPPAKLGMDRNKGIGQ
jgi:hypothetical protein